MITIIGLAAIGALIYFVFRNLNKGSAKKEQWVDPDEEFNIKKNERQKELDRILEKIQKKGMDSLKDSEKEFLKGF